jgi:hypothetical protein
MNSTNSHNEDSFTITPTVHQRPITLLFPNIITFDDINESEPIPNKVGSVPLYKSKLALVDHHRPVLVQSSAEDEDPIEGDQVQEYEIMRFKELKQFRPSVLTEQLNEGCIYGITDLSNAVVEQLLNEFFDTDSYEWSCIEESERKIVLVRFTEKDLKSNAYRLHRLLALENIEVRGRQLKAIVERNTKQFVSDTVGDGPIKIDTEELQKRVNKIIESNKIEKLTTDLDYVIDENELKDIPKDVLPQLVKDIKEFRLKALENERKKREKEVLEEKKRSKAQLRKLFEKFQNDSNEMVEDDEESDDDEDNDLTDEQYEEARIQRENANMLKRFNEKLRHVEAEQRRNKYIIEDLNEAKNYESTFDKALRPEYENGKFRPSGRNRELELDADKRDKEEEETEKVAAKESESFLASINIPLKVNITKNTNLPEIDDESLEKVLMQLKPKVDDYIEDALGVKEDELSEYVIAIIRDEKSKEKLFEELEEPFGEDAKSLTEKIWADVKQFVNDIKI